MRILNRTSLSVLSSYCLQNNKMFFLLLIVLRELLLKTTGFVTVPLNLSRRRETCTSLHPADRIKKKVISGKGEGMERGGEGDYKGIIRWRLHETFTRSRGLEENEYAISLDLSVGFRRTVIYHPLSLRIWDSREPRPRYVIMGEPTQKDVRQVTLIRVDSCMNKYLRKWRTIIMEREKSDK